jgi:UDP-2-acetamido-2-deoxy-ribo-hexuluronate aminotransferase
MTIPFIDLRSQFKALEPDIRGRIDTVLEHGQYIMGPEVGELEEKLAAYIGVKHCITVASGTEALLISLMALGVKAGDEVITTPFTFAATAEVIVLLGAKPVFVDIEPDTCNIDAAKIEAKITERTKAIMPVSLYGQPADMNEINAIAARHGGIPVIEDAAQSFGAEYQGRKSCNLSTIGCTSFFPSKPLGCYGDGGAIFTNDDQIAHASREIRVHGQSSRYVHTRVGVGGRMDTIQCAIVLAKFARFEQESARRRAIAGRYQSALAELDVTRIAVRTDRLSIYAQYTILVENRRALMTIFESKKVPFAVHYPSPVNEQPAYADFCCPNCTPVASLMANRVFSIPMSPDLSQDDQDTVISTLETYFRHRGQSLNK